MSKLSELEQGLAEATDQLREAEERANAARREETVWINRVNEAQRKLDALVKEIRDAAPHSTNWKHAQRHGQAVSE